MFLMLLGVLLAPSTAAATEAAPCYDAAFVGRIVRPGSIVSVSDDFTHQNTWRGLIQRDANVIGAVPKLSWMRLTMGGVPLRTSKFLLLVKVRPGDEPEVIRVERVPPRSSGADWLRTVNATDLRRCIN